LTHLSTLLNAAGGRVAAIESRNGSLRVFFALVTLNHFLRYSILKVHVAAPRPGIQQYPSGGAF